jgi:plasmid stabilization system protein ParE
MSVVIAEAAELDLIRIGERIGQDNRARAVSFVQELLDHCLQISRRLGRSPKTMPFSPASCVGDHLRQFLSSSIFALQTGLRPGAGYGAAGGRHM